MKNIETTKAVVLWTLAACHDVCAHTCRGILGNAFSIPGVMRTNRILQVPLLLWALTSVQAVQGAPPFSWSRVPLYAHLGVGDGLRPWQYKFLADHFTLITFTGGIMKRSKSVEPNIAAAARAVKQENPRAKVLFYWAADMPKHQWKLSNASFPKGGYLHAGKKKYFNVARRDVRNWWSGVAAKAVRDYSCDGIFVDGATAGRPGGPWSRRFGPEKAAVLDAGMFAMLKEARKKMGSGGLIIFNPLHGYDKNHAPLGQRYLAVTDGAMIDDFDRAANLRSFTDENLGCDTCERRFPQIT